MATMMKDYYELLGLAHNASGEAIRKAFRKLAMECHPDLATDKPAAEEKFKEINEAYEVLSDEDTRRKYDLGEGRWHRFSSFGSRHVRKEGEQFRATRSKGPFRPYTERPEFRSFYEEFFRGNGEPRGGFSNGERNTGSNGFQNEYRPPQRGKDIEGEVLISLEEVLVGTIHIISVQRQNPITNEAEPGFLHVRIPAGVRDGQVLKLWGKGDYGVAGGKAGDLFLRVKVAAHPDFQVRDADLTFRLELTAWEALFGVKKTVPTLEGNIRLKVPPGTMSGHRLRLRGKGLPKDGGTYGDLYAHVSVKIPLTKMVKRVFRRS